ncbi:MAG: lipocalin-like domain-containing protein [Gammaproteobacteria bacterium]|nr:lipocalin-like domain-containing protein [Gammaproteobacteria bacterium]
MGSADTMKPELHALIGAWRLKTFQIESSNGEISYPFGESAQGVLLYSRCGLVSAQLMSVDRPQFESGDQQVGTPAEFEQNFRNCVSYYGTFELNEEEGFVIHHVERSMFPNWEGKPQKRFFKLKDNTLRISTPPVEWGNDRKFATLIWERG